METEIVEFRRLEKMSTLNGSKLREREREERLLRALCERLFAISPLAMPLVHKTQPVPRAKASIESSTSNRSSNGEPEMIYKIRFTNEKFREYSDYLERLEFYRQRIFTCRYTGRGRLTYEEALTSEFKSTQLSKMFPDIYVDPLQRKLHGLQLPMSDAVNTIQDYLNSTYFVGELVWVPSDSVSEPHEGETRETELEVVAINESAKTLQLAPHSASGASKNSNLPSSSNSTQSNGATKGRSTYTIPQAKILRKQSHLLTSDVVQNKIMCVASRGHYKDAPWLLHESALSKMSKPLPTLSAAATQAIKAKAPLEKKVGKRKRDEDSTAELTKPTLRTEEEPRAKKKATTANGAATDAKTQKAGTSEGGTSRSKYPMEDLDVKRVYLEHPPPAEPIVPKSWLSSTTSSSMDVDGETEEDSTVVKKTIMKPKVDPKLLAQPVLPATDFFVPQNCVSELLMLCSYLSAFHETLTLTPFPAEDLVMALNHPEPSSLLGEVHHRILRHLNAHNNNLPKMSAKVWEPNLVYYLKAKLPLFGHVALFAKLKREGYFSLSFAQKLQILSFIAHMVSQNRIIERPASDYPEKKARIERAAQEAQLKLKRQYKTQKANGIAKGGESYLSAADLKAKLAEEEEKFVKDSARLAAVRTKPLGRDRYHNTYWWFGKNMARACVNGSPTISLLDASVLVEYYDGNIDYESSPDLEEYVSDEEERQDAITYLNVALPGSSWAGMQLDLDDFEDDDYGDGASRRRNEEIEYDHNGRGIRKAKLNAMSMRDEDEEEEDDEDDSERRKGNTCEICLTSTDMHKMLLCDQCDKAHHMYCLQPPLTRIPDGDWYCPVCKGGALPPPPTDLPVSVSTRAGQQRLLEMQIAAVKREEEAQRRRQEEAARQREREEKMARIAAERAKLIAQQKAAEEAALAAAKAAQSATQANQASGAVGSGADDASVSGISRGSSAMDVTPIVVTTSASPATVEPTTLESTEVPSPATNSTPAQSAMAIDIAKSTSGEAPKDFSGAVVSETGAPAEVPDDGVQAPAVSGSKSNRPTYNHLQPAPKREKATGTYMKPRVNVRWGYYETLEELELLLAWLDDRGVRERELKANLVRKMPAIVDLMLKRREQFKKGDEELETNAVARRTTRQTSAERKPALEPFQAYVNKAAENAR